MLTIKLSELNKDMIDNENLDRNHLNDLKYLEIMKIH